MVGHRKIPGHIQDVAVSGDRAYVVVPGGLVILDISDPARLRERGRYEIPYRVEHVAVSDRWVFLAGDVLWVLDVSDPLRPREAGHYNIPEDATDITVSQGYVLVATRSAGLQILALR